MNRENPAATPQRKRQISKSKRAEDGLGLFRGGNEAVHGEIAEGKGKRSED